MEENNTGNGNLGELPEDIQRWTAKRRAALVLSIIKGETSAAEAARKHGLTVAEVEGWKEKFLRRPRTPCAHGPRTRRRCKEQIKKLKRKVGSSSWTSTS